MSDRSRSAGAVCGALGALIALALATLPLAGVAYGERTQRGTLISSLDGQLVPLALPRDRLAPIAVRLRSGLQTSDGSPLPRVRRIELSLPAQGVVSTRGLPVCSQRRLTDARPFEALAACRGALVGRGWLKARVGLPNQGQFGVHARLLAFNGRIGGSRAVILHTYAADPPTVAVLSLRLRRQPGRFGLGLVADLPRALGPWPRLSGFGITLSRRYSYRGARRSYLSASCPLPERVPAGFFSFARTTYSLAGGGQIATAITRGCRAR